MRAVILDMDGVIVDSEHQWKLAEGAFLRRIAPGWREEDHHKLVGLGVVDLYYWLVREYGIKEPLERFLADCDVLSKGIYNNRVSLTDGLAGFIADVKKNRVPLGLASSSPKSWIDMVLDRFGLRKDFDAVVNGDETPGRTKPAPDLYLLAAERLAVKPRECLAIEDSVLGVRAAKSAGMACAGFRNGTNEEQDFSQADFEIRSFLGLSYGSLSSRLKGA